VVAINRRGRTAVILIAVLLLALFATSVRLQLGGQFSAHAIDDVGQGVAALIASGCGAFRALNSKGRARLSWTLLSLGTISWAAGQSVWSYYELISTRDTPFPSYADLGFLLFPAFALPGLLTRPAAAFAGRGRARSVLDGLMVAASLFTVSWVTVLGQVYRTSSGSGLALIVGLAYPITDLVMITIGVLVVVQARTRAGLLLLVSGLISMALADSGFSYLTAAGKYNTGSYIDFAWAGAFLLLGLAALLDNGWASKPATLRVSVGYLTLPYFLVLVGIAAATQGLVKGDLLTLIVSAVAIVALLLRQLLMLLDNWQLASSVAAQREELRHQAFHDTLTGLANRALFYDRLSHALELHQRDLRPIALLFCDLDDFKMINDTLGHAAGDQVLIAVAERLRAATRTSDTVARLGGDEFAILVEDGGDPEEVSARLLVAISKPVPIGTRQVPVRASIGITAVEIPHTDTDIQDLLKQADVAMYAAKRAGKATYVTWTAKLQDDSRDDLDLRMNLAAAVAHGGIDVAYQPIVFVDGSLYGHEALARWSHNGKPVAPDVFIPVAGRAGFLPQLDMQVIGGALASTRAMESTHSISVNIALSHLADTGVAGRIERLLERYDIAPWRLIVEVPEDHAIDSPEVHRSLQALRGIGVRLALDDFGVGYSSLSRIGTLNPDIIKLDRSFVAPLGRASRHTDFVMGIIELSHRLGTMVIAEGVETEDQLAALREINCDLIQGYLSGRPELRYEPAADLTDTELAKLS
jgi:diguanylate cyclase (GGDEF)-like protein